MPSTIRSIPGVQVIEDAPDLILDGQRAHRIVVIINGTEVQILKFGDKPTLTVKVGNSVHLVHQAHIREHLQRRLG